MTLANALRERGAKVETCYFPTASHDLGKRVEPELRAFLRDNLLGNNQRRRLVEEITSFQSEPSVGLRLGQE